MSDWHDQEDLIAVNGFRSTRAVSLGEDGVGAFVHVTLVHQEDPDVMFEFAMSLPVAATLGWHLIGDAAGYFEDVAE